MTLCKKLESYFSFRSYSPHQTSAKKRRSFDNWIVELEFTTKMIFSGWGI